MIDLSFRALRNTLLGLALLPLAAMVLLATLGGEGQKWFLLQMLLRDVVLLTAQIVVLALALLPFGKSLHPPGLNRTRIAMMAVGLIALTYAGHLLIMHGYDLIRDEQMVKFDAAIYASGKLAWPLPPEWRGEAAALNLTFMLPVSQPVAWVSAYLPGNAALHALVSQVADPALTSPLLSGVALVALWSCARKLWPDNREIAVVCVLLLLGSGQFLFSGMSAWAMQAHLACNLVWLRLFLADRRGTDLAALALGWLATGLHQPLFHPLFVGPFLLLMLQQRRFARLGTFLIAYAAIGLFWLAWPKLTLALVAGPGSVTASAGADFLSRLVVALSENADNLGLMAANLLRLVAWQHAMTLPLLLIALWRLRGSRMAQALAIGPVVTVLLMAVILPWQGYGFGYRYLHGQLGNLVLLAGFGWLRFAEYTPSARAVLTRATLLGFLVITPLQALGVYRIYGAYADADRTIAGSSAEYALVDTRAGYVADVLVINRPDLSNRPVRLMAPSLSDPASLAARICKPGTRVAMGNNRFYRRIDTAYWIGPVNAAEARMAHLAAPFRRAGCQIVILS